LKLAYTVDTICLSQLVASVTHQSRWCVDYENAYSFFNHPKVKILSRLFLYSGTYSQNDGTDFAMSNLKQSYKPKGTWFDLRSRDEPVYERGLP
jgi:hypothetical protein